MKKIYLLITIMGLLFITNSCSEDEEIAEQIQEETHNTGVILTPSNLINGVNIISPPSSGNIPSSNDLSGYMPPVGNQGGQNSCASWATGYYLKAFHEHLDQNTTYGSDNSGLYSPSFLYNLVKEPNGDNGSYIFNNLNRLKSIGICEWNLMPYNDNDYTTMPSNQAIQNAHCGKILDWGIVHYNNLSQYNLSNLDKINISKQLLSISRPLVIAIPVDEDFNKSQPKTNGEYKYSYYNSDKHKGYHAIVLVGYDDSKQAFKAVNSWGTDWGNNGYFWFDYFLYGDIAYEVYSTIDLVDNCDTTSQSSEISVSGNLNFGDVEVNQTATRTLTIENTGTADFNVSSITNTSGFSSSYSGTITAGNSKDVTVTFAPTTEQSYNGTITVNSNADNGSGTINCSGTGYLASSSVISLSGNLSYGNVEVGTTATRILTISNTGTADFNVSSITNPSGFSSTYSGTVTAGNSKDVTVTFAPTTEQSYNGMIIVNSNADNGSETINCSGTGYTASSSAISLSGNLSFGDVEVGSSLTRTLTISNTGTADFNVSSITNPSGFSSTYGGTVTAGNSKDVTVIFAPTTEQSYNGTITVNSNADNGNSSISCSGIGVILTSTISLSGDMNFGDVEVNQSATRTLTISNIGTADFNVSSMTNSNGFTSSYSGIVTAGNSVGVTVTFSPISQQNYNGTIIINADNDNGNSQINCFGNGIDNNPIGNLKIINNTSYSRYFHIKKQSDQNYDSSNQIVIPAGQTSYYYNLETGIYLYEAHNTDFYGSDFYYSSGQINITNGNTSTVTISN